VDGISFGFCDSVNENPEMIQKQTSLSTCESSCYVMFCYCTISLNSYVTCQRAQNLRIFSNLSWVTEGIFEYGKKKSQNQQKKMAQKIQLSRAQRVFLVDGVTRTFLVRMGPSEHQAEHLL
jgi:hypothetical protein